MISVQPVTTDDMRWGAPKDRPGIAGEPVPGKSESLADTIEWLFLVFEQRLGLTTVLEVVQSCCRELNIESDATGLNRLEPMAHKRLTGLTIAAGVGPPIAEPIRVVSRTGPRRRG